MSAPPATAPCSASQPVWRPITSTIMTRRWLSAVVRTSPTAQATRATAVSKPNVTSVESRSLSIVFGTPRTRSPPRESCRAVRSEPSPPMTTSAPARFCSSTWRAARSRGSGRTNAPPGPRRNWKRPLFVEPRIVPPVASMPCVLAGVSTRAAAGSSSPSYPSHSPTVSMPRCAAAQTMPRMTAFSPGQSPPAVSRAKRMAGMTADLRAPSAW